MSVITGGSPIGVITVKNGTSLVNSFSTFGYFKSRRDAQRVIDLFGDEIKELFVEGE